MAAILSAAYSWATAAITPAWTMARAHPIAASLVTLALGLSTIKLVRHALFLMPTLRLLLLGLTYLANFHDPETNPTLCLFLVMR